MKISPTKKSIIEALAKPSNKDNRGWVHIRQNHDYAYAEKMMRMMSPEFAKMHADDLAKLAKPAPRPATVKGWIEKMEMAYWWTAPAVVQRKNPECPGIFVEVFIVPAALVEEVWKLHAVSNRVGTARGLNMAVSIEEVMGRLGLTPAKGKG